jgi:hypothetical protein
VVSRLALALALAACQAPGAGTPASTRPAPPPQQMSALDLIGGWRWTLRTDDGGASRVEDERWRLRPDPSAPGALTGRYVRSVEVVSRDRKPFGCNQRPWYRQRALFEVVAEPVDGGFTVRETAYTTEPSPCDHGFRHVGAYRAELAGSRLALSWSGEHGSGTETLWQVDDELAPLPDAPWPAQFALAGAWRWDASSFGGDGDIRDESEWWEITRRSPTRVDLTYRRRVVTRSADGAIIACAGAPSWSFDDAYVLDGQQEEEHWHFHELAVSPGDHPCLRASPRRALDEATAEQIGDFLVLEWRGKRRQVLYRPD